MGCCMSTSEEWYGYAKSTEKPDWKSSRKRRAKSTLAAEAKHDEQLLLFPGRICRNGASNIASLYTQQGKKGVNQDAMVLWEDFGSRKDTTFCGVFDGHGPYGHLVAARVRDSLPSKLLSHLQAGFSSQSDKKANISDNGGSLEMLTCIDDEKANMWPYWTDAHMQACKMMDKELRLHPSIDCFSSGTTAVTILKQGEHLIIGNIGDSRAVMATKADDDSIIAVQLTVDLKPDLPEEAERIRQCKGRVFALNDEPDVHRVWLPHNNSPGLAMARAFGDFCLKDYGVIAIPEISYRHISDRDQFIVLATDGVWDVLSNQEAVDIICSAPSRGSAARDLVDCAVQAWRVKYPTSKVDDCAVVCVYVNDIDLPIQETINELDDGLHYVKQLPPSVKVDDPISNSSEVATIEAFINSLGTELQYESGIPDGIDLEEHEWSALEGVTRVNSLLNLPRFVPGVEDVGVPKRRR